MDIDGLHELVKNLREDFNAFKTNDFHNFHTLQEKVDKLGVKVGWIVGIISALTLVANILIRFL